MTPAEIEQKAAEEAFLRGFYDIPEDEKLQQMSFVELATLLASCEVGSARFLVVEQEMLCRRNSGLTEVPNKKGDWHEMPFGKIAIGVVTTIIGACALYLIATHFGVKLN